MVCTGRQYAPNSEYALNSEVRLITRFYGMLRYSYAVYAIAVAYTA